MDPKDEIKNEEADSTTSGDKDDENNKTFEMAHNPELLLTSEAFWAMISAQYFPQVLTQHLLDEKQEFSKFIESVPYSQSKTYSDNCF
jgi:hypothetical protein